MMQLYVNISYILIDGKEQLDILFSKWVTENELIYIKRRYALRTVKNWWRNSNLSTRDEQFQKVTLSPAENKNKRIIEWNS